MPRKLKTYITNLGFFELALAAPSMKAALEAWGMGHNAFHQGFARETDDPKIVAAAMAKPGVVLKRPVGTKGPFQENAALPKDWTVSPPERPKAQAKTKPQEKIKEKAKAKSAKADKQARADIISFEKEKARRDRAREKDAAREEARREKERAERARNAGKAKAALEKAEARYEEAMAAIEKERDKLDRRAKIERERWAEEREDLKAALRAAGD